MWRLIVRVLCQPLPDDLGPVFPLLARAWVVDTSIQTVHDAVPIALSVSAAAATTTAV